MGHDEHLKLAEEMERLREDLAQKDQEIENLKIDNLFLGTLFDGISEEILVLNPDFNIKDANKAFLRRYGRKKSEVLGKKCYEIKQRSGAPCRLENEKREKEKRNRV